MCKEFSLDPFDIIKSACLSLRRFLVVDFFYFFYLFHIHRNKSCVEGSFSHPFTGKMQTFIRTHKISDLEKNELKY